ncbi:MAG: hypothetical protein M1815_006032 [Lichina confinis]|nr:MAG: hypothetical protein M1815_006032 [Lichina confinis]
MSSDDLYFLDVLSSIPNDVRRYSAQVADAVDRHINQVAGLLKDQLSPAWNLGSSPLQPPPPPPQKPVPAAERIFGAATQWIRRHQIVTAVVVITVGAHGFYLYRRYRHSRKRRRARRASNGARKEVVVIAGSASEPLSLSLSLDLERRGFIVYVVANSLEEEQMIHNQSRADIRPLMLDITDPSSTKFAVDRFDRYLHLPQVAFSGAIPHQLKLAGFILIPDTSYPSGPLETISPETWSDALNVKILGTVATTQAFLRSICDFKAPILLLAPSIIPSLSLPFHGIESSVVSALESYGETLRAELAPTGVQVTHFKLGTFDRSSIPGNGGRNHTQAAYSNVTRADVLTWSSSARTAYGKTYLSQAPATKTWSGVGGEHEGRLRGTPLRELHRAVFDTLTSSTRSPKVMHVGSGSLLYDVVGRWAPPALVGRMLGVRRRMGSEGLAGDVEAA